MIWGKEKGKKIFLFLGIFVSLFLFCAGPSNAAYLSKKKLVLSQYSEYTLKVLQNSASVRWSSSDSSVAVVTSKGKVTGKKAGSCIVSASSKGKKYSCKVTVKPVTLSKTSFVLTKSCKAILKLQNASGKIAWASSNKKIAEVDKNGKVYGKAAGTCTIAANYEGRVFKCQVKVEATTISSRKLELEAGSTSQLTVNRPIGKTKWSASSSSIATVSSTGLVTAKSEGTCTITAVNNKKKYSCTVTVHAFKLSRNEATMIIRRYLKLSVSNCSGAPSFKTSNPAVAEVDANGLIHAVGKGRCTITATYGGVSRTCAITVIYRGAHADRMTDLLNFYQPSGSQSKILLAGSSSLELWANAGEDLMPMDPTMVLNMGISGSTVTEWMNWYSKLIVDYNPSVLVLYLGVNDINRGMSGDLNARNTMQLIKWIREQLPNVPVFYCSIVTAPRRYGTSCQEQMVISNQMMKEYCENTVNVSYVDIYSGIMSEDETGYGKPIDEYFTLLDSGERDIHPSLQGYEIWRSLLYDRIHSALVYNGTLN